MALFEPVLMRNVGVDNSSDIAVYKSRGGYEAVAKALKMTTASVTEEIKAANLRGRGGAGFPAGVKWGFLPKDRQITYLCVNADESEPPTFNNRILMQEDPHQLLEGVLIAGYATRTTVAYIYMRGEFAEQFHVLQKALDQAYEAGLFGKRILGSDFNTFSGNTAEDNGLDGFRLDVSDDNTFNENDAKKNGRWGFLIDALGDNVFVDNACDDNAMGGSNLAGVCPI